LESINSTTMIVLCHHKTNLYNQFKQTKEENKLIVIKLIK